MQFSGGGGCGEGARESQRRLSEGSGELPGENFLLEWGRGGVHRNCPYIHFSVALDVIDEVTGHISHIPLNARVVSTGGGSCEELSELLTVRNRSCFRTLKKLEKECLHVFWRGLRLTYMILFHYDVSYDLQQSLRNTVC